MTETKITNKHVHAHAYSNLKSTNIKKHAKLGKQSQGTASLKEFLRDKIATLIAPSARYETQPNVTTSQISF